MQMRGLFLGAMGCAAIATAMVVGACSSDETGTTPAADAGAGDGSTTTPKRDATPGDDDAAPGCGAGTAPDPVPLEIVMIDPPVIANKLAGATFDVIKRSDRSVIATATTDANGAASLDVPTGGVALDALMRFTAPPGDAGPRVPFIVEVQHGIQTKETFQGGIPAFSLLSDVATELGTTLDPTKVIVQVQVGNCSHTGYAGATIAIEGGTVFYNKGGPMTFDATMTATGVAGMGAAFNVAPGATKITVTYEGETITHTITTVAGDLHFVFITP